MVAKQLENALAQARKEKSSRAQSGRGRADSRIVRGESKGEAVVRLALQSAFGLWESGGEVVSELMPFTVEGSRYRADFALPRYRFYLEIDGWSSHGFTKEAHHSDRLRGLYFSARGWLPFRVSHGQAVNSPHILVEAVQAAMALRDPLPRAEITVEPVPHKHGVWHRLAKT